MTLNFPTPIDPALEAPFVFTAGGYSVVVKQFNASGVVLENMSGHASPYLLAIVPTMALMAARSDWRVLWKQFMARLKGAASQ
jgi:hypothetical protein